MEQITVDEFEETFSGAPAVVRYFPRALAALGLLLSKTGRVTISMEHVGAPVGGFLSMREAAILVLEQAAVPLHYRTITKRALAQGLMRTDGKTPHFTLGCVLSRSVKRADSQFVRVDDGVYALKD